MKISVINIHNIATCIGVWRELEQLKYTLIIHQFSFHPLWSIVYSSDYIVKSIILLKRANQIYSHHAPAFHWYRQRLQYIGSFMKSTCVHALTLWTIFYHLKNSKVKLWKITICLISDSLFYLIHDVLLMLWTCSQYQCHSASSSWCFDAPWDLAQQ